MLQIFCLDITSLIANGHNIIELTDIEGLASIPLPGLIFLFDFYLIYYLLQRHRTSVKWIFPPMKFLKEPCSKFNVLYMFFPFVRNMHNMSDYYYVVLNLLRLRSIICLESCYSHVIEGILLYI